MDLIKLIAGRSNPDLSQKIADHLGLVLVKRKIVDFSNGEIYVEIGENIRGSDVYVIETGAEHDGHSLNDFYVEALQIADACILSGVRSISLIYAIYPYSRSDKKNIPGISSMSSVIAHSLQNVGYSRLITMDIHSPQIQDVIKLPFENLY